MINRRALSLACLALPAVFAASASSPKSSLGGDQLPFRAVSVPEDGRRVLIFFDFACPFSASFHGSFVSFLTTVPNKVQASFVPVVNPVDTPRLKEQAIAAQCFYAAAANLSTSQMSLFMSAVYADYAQRLDLTSKAMWSNACGAAGLSLKKFSASLAPKLTQSNVQYAALKTSSYALTATPSVAVGGAYVITPEDVRGDMEMYFNLLNGLTSRLL